MNCDVVIDGDVMVIGGDDVMIDGDVHVNQVNCLLFFKDKVTHMITRLMTDVLSPCPTICCQKTSSTDVESVSCSLHHTVTVVMRGN
jgi:hypothetical protein